MRDTRDVMHKDIIVTVQTIEYIGKNASVEEWFEKKINLVSKVIPRNRLSMFQSPLVNCFLKRISLGHWTKLLFVFTVQKQPPRSVPRKRCSENMQQIYRRHPCRSAISSCCIFLEHLFLGSPLGGCYWQLYMSSQVRDGDLDYFFKHQSLPYTPSLPEFGKPYFIVKSVITLHQFLTSLLK